jgi:hypothetical protein
MSNCRTACVLAVTRRHGACPAAPLPISAYTPRQPALLAFAEPAWAGTARTRPAACCPPLQCPACAAWRGRPELDNQRAATYAADTPVSRPKGSVRPSV